MDGVQHIPRIVVQKETNLKVWKAVLSSFVCCYQPPLRERLGWPPLASLSPHCQLDGHEICMQLSILLLNGCETMPGSSHACQIKLGTTLTTWNHPFRILQNPSESFRILQNPSESFRTQRKNPAGASAELQWVQAPNFSAPAAVSCFDLWPPGRRGWHGCSTPRRAPPLWPRRRSANPGLAPRHQLFYKRKCRRNNLRQVRWGHDWNLEIHIEVEIIVWFGALWQFANAIQIYLKRGINRLHCSGRIGSIYPPTPKTTPVFVQSFRLLDHWMLLVLDWHFGFLRFSEQIWSLRDSERFPGPTGPGHFLHQVTGYIWRHPQGSHVLQGLQGTLPVRLPGAICQHLIVATPGLPATPATPKP